MSENTMEIHNPVSDEKCDIISPKIEADEEFKLKDEESMDSISETSSLNLDEASESEKFNSAAKRKQDLPPLLVTNLPEHYSLQDVADYLEKLCGPCSVNISKNRNGSRVFEAIFKSEFQRTDAKKILNSHTIDEVKIRVASPGYSDTESECDGPRAKRKKEREDVPWGMDADVWRSDPKGWYGVKPHYLATLGIKNQLQNWVLVQNFRCGRDELKEAMELAGDVVVCSLHSLSTSNRHANVMYRHPLEALQAVSMLNGQMFYGRPLTVKIIKINGVILPKGLQNVGPGLAKYGRPLRDVVRHYEWYIKGQDNGLNTNIFRTPQEQCSNDDDDYSEECNDNEKKAKEALETLVNLVAQGVKVQDLLLELRAIKADNKNSIDQLIRELDTSDVESNHDANNPPPPGTSSIRNASRDENRSSPVNSKSYVKSAIASPDNSKTPKESSQNLQHIATISSNRPKPPQIRPVAPVSAPTSNYQGVGGPRPMGPGPSRPMGPGPSRPMGPGPSRPMGPGPSRPMGPGPSGPMAGPANSRGMVGPAGSMPRPTSAMTGPMMGPMPRPMSGPMSGGMSGPRPGSMSGPMTGPMSGPMSGPMCGPRPNSIPVRMPTPMSGMSGPNSGPNGPMTSGRPTGPAGPMSGPIAGPNFSMPGPNTHPPFGPTVNPTGPEASVLFSNLPPTTTFALLSDTLSKVGQLVSIQFTTPGCVVVKFGHRTQAERCIQQYDKSLLEGNLVTVNFIQ